MHSRNFPCILQLSGCTLQDKVDGNGAESKINNNWENRQNFRSKIGGFMASWPYSTFEKIQVYKLFL